MTPFRAVILFIAAYMAWTWFRGWRNGCGFVVDELDGIMVVAGSAFFFLLAEVLL